MIPQTVDTTLIITSGGIGRTWRARLPNGRDILAFRPAESAPITLETGAQVPARLTVCDFSRALLILPEDSASSPPPETVSGAEV